jgi:hypothetical protein
VVSDDAGRFAVTALPPGRYTLTVEAPGFKKYSQTNLPLAVQQQTTLDVVLEVGEVSTSVEVVNTLDAALLKSWRTKETQRIEFRLETQNVRNHPIFSDPPTSYGASNFGVISQTKIGSRNVQLGFKYYF